MSLGGSPRAKISCSGAKLAATIWRAIKRRSRSGKDLNRIVRPSMAATARLVVMWKRKKTQKKAVGPSYQNFMEVAQLRGPRDLAKHERRQWSLGADPQARCFHPHA